MLCFNMGYELTVARGRSIRYNILLISDAADAKAVRDALVGSSDGLFNVDWVRSRADGLLRLGGTASGSVAAVLADLFLTAQASIRSLSCTARRRTSRCSS
jgi:hypothetical protein